jgi:hypothetical protein
MSPRSGRALRPAPDLLYRGTFFNPSEGSMRALVVAVVCLAAIGCEISPVVSSPEPTGSRYSDCERAALAYCEDVIRARGTEMDACIAEHVYECVSSGATSRGPGRS